MPFPRSRGPIVIAVAGVVALVAGATTLLDAWDPDESSYGVWAYAPLSHSTFRPSRSILASGFVSSGWWIGLVLIVLGAVLLAGLGGYLFGRQGPASPGAARPVTGA